MKKYTIFPFFLILFVAFLPINNLQSQPNLLERAKQKAKEIKNKVDNAKTKIDEVLTPTKPANEPNQSPNTQPNNNPNSQPTVTVDTKPDTLPNAKVAERKKLPSSRQEMLDLQRREQNGVGIRSQEWKSPIELGGNYSNSSFTDLFMVDNKTGYVIGNDGVILKTTDGGDKWVGQNSNLIENLTCMFFVDKNTGWICGANGTILHTIDGGQNWLIQTENNSFIDIYFIDSNKGFAVGGGLYCTENGGKTWEKKGITDLVIKYNSYDFSRLNSIYFLDNQNGYAISLNDSGSDAQDSYFVKTSDGGKTWAIASRLQNGIFDVVFLDSMKGFACGFQGLIHRTLDGGKTWSVFGTGTLYILRLSFVDSNTGWAVSYTGEIFYTSDGGNNWRTSEKTCAQKIDDFYEQNLGKGKYLGYKAQVDCPTLSDIQFTNTKEGIAIGANGRIIKTTDGGVNWKVVSFNINSILTALSFVNEQTVWAISESQYILKTIDGGVNWNIVNSSIPEIDGKIFKFNNILFIDQNIGWIIGGYGLVLKTVDGGKNWVKQVTNSSLFFTRIFFINHEVGWIMGDQGIIYKTTDGGLTWVLDSQKGIIINGWIVTDKLNKLIGGDKFTTIKIPEKTIVSSLFFITDKKGWIVSWTGRSIYKTDDGGENWIKQDSKKTKDMGDIYFQDENKGWILCNGGNILMTNDGGNNWNLINKAARSDLYSIKGKGNSILTVGANGTILIYQPK